ncbi:hypothetical protein [uncultured Hoeflea sp.]|uniref:hypothetical protein n=1 Tax=uncultured Hoeflea sp. TaxID=538666 RepID=UPI00261831E2|nr:hypothetical protein [uncultured Hoeflea sp.]
MKPLMSLFAATALAGLPPLAAQAASAPLPHVIFEYTFRDNGARWDLSVERHYETCTYVGPHGAFKVPAEFGKCPTIRWFRDDGSVQ